MCVCFRQCVRLHVRVNESSCRADTDEQIAAHTLAAHLQTLGGSTGGLKRVWERVYLLAVPDM